MVLSPFNVPSPFNGNDSITAYPYSSGTMLENFNFALMTITFNVPSATLGKVISIYGTCSIAMPR